MAQGSEDARDRSQVLYETGEYEQCLAAALEGLNMAPDDVELLMLAGRAGVELDSPDAIEHLIRATEVAPREASAWHHYGEALAAEGSMKEADAAFRRAVELDPDDQVALTNLGHTALGAGRSEEGIGYLARAADADAASTAAISLVDMYRSLGQYEEALAQARRLADAVPDDALALLDVAELSVALGRLDEARSAFERLRELDDVPGHEAFPVLGLIQLEIAGANWDRAGELTEQAAAIDPQGLSSDLAAFLREQSGAGDREGAPTRAEVETALATSLADYRRMLADDRRLSVGNPGA